MKALLPTLAVLTALTGTSIATHAAAQPAIPPPQAELGEPPPPPGPPERFVLEPGHWKWGPRAGRYYWVPRHWIPTFGYHAVFVPGHWQRPGLWIPSHWNRQ